mmetsp:Transcript_62102/g.134550  ORF Transcript_62102/g.134550 Transcript_62102/m.134550 type:complete len:387 (-) Transcript_62102:18-1178(-)
MGKKGKKKAAKKTGTPDVQKFKETREFHMLKECVTIQESLPFVAVDVLDDMSYQKIARFLNMVGLLAEHLQAMSSKDYRFMYHHKFLAPTPQYFPFGFSADCIRQARAVTETPGVKYNGEEYPFTEALREASDGFLKNVDAYMTKLASEIEPRLKDDFATGLKHFKAELKEDLKAFDETWVEYERQSVQANHDILAKVFEPVDKLVTLETLLTAAEERLDIEAKQKLEDDLVRAVEDFTLDVCEVAGEAFPEYVIPLAEACLFYESKCSEEWLHHAKYVIKDYIELRIFITKIPEERLSPELSENYTMIRLLKAFHESVLAARPALEYVSKLPKLIHAKTANWMTKRLLEPDVKYIHQTAHLAMEEMREQEQQQLLQMQQQSQAAN